METMNLHSLWTFIYDYLKGENNEGENRTLANDLALRGITHGKRILIFKCPNPMCRRPLYFLEEFGPACSGSRGGCGRKAPRGKRKPFEK